MHEKNTSITDADVLVSNRRMRGLTPHAKKIDPPQGEQRALPTVREPVVPSVDTPVSQATQATVPSAGLSFDPATAREELTQLLESWLDEEIPKYVLRAMDGVSDRMISRLTSSARAKLMPRLLDLIETAQAAASVAAMASINTQSLEKTTQASMAHNLQDLADKIETAQVRFNPLSERP